MKISIVVGGRWHAFDLARELDKAGYLHRLITNYPKFKTRQWGIPDEKVVSLPLSLLLNRLTYRFLANEPNWQTYLNSLFAKSAVNNLEGSTLVHGWAGNSTESLLWAKQNKVPFVLERSSAHVLEQYKILRQEHQQLGLKFHEPSHNAFQVALEEYELTSHIAVPSLFVKRSFLTQKFSEIRLVRNPFGTNLQAFSPGKKQDNVFRVIYAGSLSVRKGIHYLIKAFTQANIPNSELLLVGGSTSETPLLLTGVDNRIKYIGHVPQAELAQYYRNSSVFLIASIEEGLACVQVQALACGLPLICTTNTGGEDLLRMSNSEPILQSKNIEEYPAGYLVPIRDSEAIADCLKTLAQDPKLLKSKCEAALSISQSGLSWSAYAQRSIMFYQSLHT